MRKTEVHLHPESDCHSKTITRDHSRLCHPTSRVPCELGTKYIHGCGMIKTLTQILKYKTKFECNAMLPDENETMVEEYYYSRYRETLRACVVDI